MVNITHKQDTLRQAVARATLIVSSENPLSGLKISGLSQDVVTILTILFCRARPMHVLSAVPTDMPRF
jgi:hypothetical protein